MFYLYIFANLEHKGVWSLGDFGANVLKKEIFLTFQMIFLMAQVIVQKRSMTYCAQEMLDHNILESLYGVSKKSNILTLQLGRRYRMGGFLWWSPLVPYSPSPTPSSAQRSSSVHPCDRWSSWHTDAWSLCTIRTHDYSRTAPAIGCRRSFSDRSGSQ